MNTPAPPLPKKRLPQALLALGLGGLMLGAGTGWLLGTESGLNASLALAGRLSGGQLEAEGVQGRLWGPIKMETLRWEKDGELVQLSGLDLEWQPGELFQGRIAMQRLEARELRLQLAPGPEDTPPPRELTLPLALQVDLLKLERLYLGEPEDPSAPLLTQLEARLESDGQLHRLTHLGFSRENLRVQAKAELRGTDAMPLKAELQARGELAETPVSLNLEAEGPLAALPLRGRIEGKGVEGKLTATLTPFAGQPFSLLQARFSGFDPALWHPQVPTARIDLELDIRPRPDNSPGLLGELRLANHQSAPLERQGLPLENLRAELAWQAKTLNFTSLAAAFPGGGSFQGQLQLDLEGSGGFELQGRMKDLDPARLQGSLPQARINGQLGAGARFAEPFHLNLDFQLEDSRIAGKAFAGNGKLQASADRLRDVDIQLRAGDNRLQARGNLGQPGDSLELDIRAPRLADLGLGGDLEAQLKLAGPLNAPLVSGKAASRSLTLPGLLQLRGLNLETRMSPELRGPLQVQLSLEKLELPSQGQTRSLSGTRLQVSGNRQQHQLELESTLAFPEQPLLAQAPLKLKASGGQQGQGWRGRIDSLELGGQAPLLSLAEATPLELGEQIRFGPARIQGKLKGESWQARIDTLKGKGRQWQSAGRLEGLPLAPFLPPPATGRLRLDGQWDLVLGPSPRGKLSLWRRDGDLQLGSAPVTALGLGETRLDLSLEGQPRLQIKAEGQRLGQVQGDIRLHARDPIGQPWSGQITARMADLAWTSPLLGPSLQIGGRLEGAVRLSGTPLKPRFAGNLKGEALQLRELESGLRLESGQVVLGFDEHRLSLEKFQFSSPHAPLPRDLSKDQQAGFQAITASPGRLEGKGTLSLGAASSGTDAQLEFRLERLGVMQKPQQWVALSGQGRLQLEGEKLGLGARLQVDGGYWKLADMGAPKLSDDVVVRRQAASAPPPRSLKTVVDLQVELGRNFHFAGAGVQSRLEGNLHLNGQGQEALRATGSIRTVNGRFDAYGQKLDIEQGILSFNGLLTNPGLNIRAVRKNLPVEAGVSITGTALKPVVTLISNPSVPDAEKLSWLVLGEAPEQQSGADFSTLLTAANAILGGQDGGPGSLLRELQQTLGLNVSVGKSNGSTSLRSQVASSSGFGSSETTTSSQVVRVGTQLAKGLNLSYEQSLAGTESVVKLTLALSRRLSLVGQAGTDNAVDLFYNFRFGNPEEPRQKRAPR